MDNHLLSKTSFIRGLQCIKSLYLNKYYPDLRDDPDQRLQELFRKGNDVGKLARELFPGGIDCSPKDHTGYENSIKLTRELASKKNGVLYEAAFQYDSVLCFMDILANDGTGWRAYEVKSSTGITDTYVMDASLQYNIISNSGLSLEDINIVYINNKYVRRDDLDINSLFNIESVYDSVLNNQEFVEENIERLKNIINSKKIPEIDIGEHCYSPYECDFMGYCWRHIPQNSVFDIARLSKYEKFNLYRAGIIRIEDLPDDYPLSFHQEMQINCYKEKNTYVDINKLKQFMKTIKYPLYFIDFESFMPHIPLFNNTRPYQHIPFQYSLHYLNDKKSDLRHSEFLAPTGIDPREEFVKRLIEDTREPGDIIVYNKGFEATRLKELALAFPEYREDLTNLIFRIKDLMIPFQKKYYYKPEMEGSYSIKSVLPALVKGPGYKNLSISNGTTAMTAFEFLQSETDKQKISEIRKDLLEYCEMDTLAMVWIFRKLEKIVKRAKPA